MKIEKVKLKEMMLDAQNPRFESRSVKLTQMDIMDMLLNTKESRELISSMKLGVIWNPYIIVRKLSEEEEALLAGYRYKIVEGNTRTAILKAGHIEDFTEESEIPVQVLKIEDFENEAQMNEVIAKIQGRTHVMGVKPWSEVSQAKHVYLMVENYRKADLNHKMNKIYVKVANELALDPKKVRAMTQRYRIFSEMYQLSGGLKQDHWSFLEAIDTTSKTRKFFGFQDENLDFEWNEHGIFFEELQLDLGDDTQLRKELLTAMSEFIQKAHSAGTLSKSFRDTVKKLIHSEEENIEEVKRKVEEVVTNKMTYPMLEESLIQGVEEKERYLKKLDSLLDSLANTPVVKDWSHELLPKLKKMEKKAKQLQMAIELQQNDD